MSEFVRNALIPLTVPELKILAIENGLSDKGSKADLIDRLLNPPHFSSSLSSNPSNQGSSSSSSSTSSSTMSASRVAVTTQTSGQREEFLKDLTSQASLKDLVPIFNTKKNGISITFYKIDEPDDNNAVVGTQSRPDGYLVAIKGRIDPVLIKLAKSPYRFPRGLFCYWIPQTYLEIFGFLPKFENDREYQTDNQSDFLGATELRISLKASGSLGMRHVVRSPLTGNLLTFYTSKKATNNLYAEQFQSLTEDHFTEPELINLDQWQVNNGFTLCAEVCFENSHGALVVAPNFFVTIISQAKKIDLKTGKISGAIGQPLIEYLPDQIMVEYCQTYNIPTDNRFSVNTLKNCQAFIQALNSQRDFMTIQTFYQLINQFAEQKKLLIINGTLSHQTVFGQDGALEGLIIQITKKTITEETNGPNETNGPKETKETVKYKFPNYTSRTFGVREAIQDNLWPRSSASVKQFMNLTPIKYRKHVEYYLKRWVLTETGRDYWGAVMYGAFQQIPKFSSEQVSTEWINNGGHILAIDWGITHPINNNDFLSPDLNLTYDINLVIVLGPVGSGKSTIAQALAPPGYNPIDGDRLVGLNLSQTMTLGQERSPLTVWEVVRDLIKYQLAIVSTGGGAFTNIRKLIADFLPQIKMHLTVYIPETDAQTHESNLCTDPKIAKDIATRTFELASQSGGITEKAILRRLESNEWQLPNGQSPKQFIDHINNNVNRGNLNFVHEFIEQANCVLTFPVVTSEQFVVDEPSGNIQTQNVVYQSPANLKLTEIPLDRTKKIDRFNYHQKRLLVGYQLPTKSTKSPKSTSSSRMVVAELDPDFENFTNFGHVTEAYSIDPVFESANVIDNPIHNTADPWQLITFAENKMSLLIPPIDHPMFAELPYAHVTIKPGKHYPADMKKVTQALREHQDSIELKTKSGELVNYELPELEQGDPILAKIICRFYL